MGFLRRPAAYALIGFLAWSCAGSPSPSPSDVVPEPRALPTPVLLVGIDGFRYDFLDRFEPPNLVRLIEKGAQAERLVPAFPSKTFPNHYTLVTGLVPDHHGIVSNNIRDEELGRFSLSNRTAVADGRWWQGEPIWVTAQRQGLRAAALFWPGSEAEIQGLRPTYWTTYDDDLPGEERITKILDWLALPAAERPSFLTLYFSRVDSAGHRYGPLSDQNRRAVLEVDALVGRLAHALEEREQTIHWVFVSDHGMAETSPARVIVVDELISLDELDMIDSSPVLALTPKNPSTPPRGWPQAFIDALDQHAHVAAYRKEELPDHLRHGSHPRVAPVIALADEGWRFTTVAKERARPQRGPGGQHGYDPTVDSMGGLLAVAGPQIRSGVRLGPVENVDVYSLLCHLLDIEPAPNDGSLNALKPALRTPN